MNKLIKIMFLFLSLNIFIFANEINIDTLVQKAKAENKNIMFYFHIPKCPYCTRMLNENFKNEEILSLINNDLLFLDIYTAIEDTYLFGDFKGSAKEFAKYLGAVAYPATLFLDSKGEVIHKAIGYRNIQEYIPELKYIISNSYKTKDLETYIMDLELGEDDDK